MELGYKPVTCSQLDGFKLCLTAQHQQVYFEHLWLSSQIAK